MKNIIPIVLISAGLLYGCDDHNETAVNIEPPSTPTPTLVATEEYKTITLSDSEKIALGIIIEDTGNNTGVIYTGAVKLENPRISPNVDLLQNGDIIVRFHDEPVRNKDDIQKILADMQPNVSAVVIVNRNGNYVSITVSPGVVDKYEQTFSA